MFKYETGIKIKFEKKDNYHFISEFDSYMDPFILITSLLKTVEDICEYYKLDAKEQLEKYKTVSVDDYKKEG